MDYSRQSYLGVNAQQTLAETRIGLIGYSGGGSHFGQQLAHIGIGKFVVIDPKIIDGKHRPRLVGSEPEDVTRNAPKVEIAKRQILRGNPTAIIETYQSKWQSQISTLSACDLIFGAVDSFSQRDELERFCRRSFIPYIDIGMDIRGTSEENFSITGQVIQSIPGGHCLWCCGLLTEKKLAKEANHYGNVGGLPQVIWANGLLASAAVGFGISLLCPWHKDTQKFRWLTYDGNTGELKAPSCFGDLISSSKCPHHPVSEVGNPLADIRNHHTICANGLA